MGQEVCVRGRVSQRVGGSCAFPSLRSLTCTCSLHCWHQEWLHGNLMPTQSARAVQERMRSEGMVNARTMYAAHTPRCCVGCGSGSDGRVVAEQRDCALPLRDAGLFCFVKNQHFLKIKYRMFTNQPAFPNVCCVVNPSLDGRRSTNSSGLDYTGAYSTCSTIDVTEKALPRAVLNAC